MVRGIQGGIAGAVSYSAELPKSEMLTGTLPARRELLTDLADDGWVFDFGIVGQEECLAEDD